MGLVIRDNRQMKALTGVSQAQLDFLWLAFNDVMGRLSNSAMKTVSKRVTEVANPGQASALSFAMTRPIRSLTSWGLCTYAIEQQLQRFPSISLPYGGGCLVSSKGVSEDQPRSRRRIATRCNWSDNAAAGPTDPPDGELLCRQSSYMEDHHYGHVLAISDARAICAIISVAAHGSTD